MPYPVVVTIEPQYRGRDRLTVALRLLLAIPHMIFVGFVGFSVASSTRNRDALSLGGEAGLLGSVAWLLAIVSWFTIVISGVHINVVRRYTRFYLRWRVRALAYMMLLADRYPPFGDGDYPTALTIADPPSRDRLSVGFRILLAIPHFVALFFLVFAWWVTSFVSWVLILITGDYPQGLYDFGAAVLRWVVRVEAYVLLMVDEYPPFSFE
ncbi:MAG TPA: DUF4389 domain-containing protein [Vicinamibacterales bacterium]|nr:DUF4389 domain-containing protein [Vicinamibacterales bacterium]